MATLEELRTLFGDGDLRRKIEAATVMVAETVISGCVTGNFETGASAQSLRLGWASDVIRNTANEAEQVHKVVLGANRTAASGAIASANDSTIITNVEQAVDGLSKTRVSACASSGIL